jgi:hypothetical protein
VVSTPTSGLPKANYKPVIQPTGGRFDRLPGIHVMFFLLEASAGRESGRSLQNPQRLAQLERVFGLGSASKTRVGIEKN